MSGPGRIEFSVTFTNEAAEQMRDVGRAFAAWSFRSTMPWPLRIVLAGMMLAVIIEGVRTVLS